jgi:hypothetical protein
MSLSTGQFNTRAHVSIQCFISVTNSYSSFKSQKVNSGKKPSWNLHVGRVRIFFISSHSAFKILYQARRRWFMLIILAIQEADQETPGSEPAPDKYLERPYLEKTITRKGWWCGSSCKSACLASVRPWVQTLVLKGGEMILYQPEWVSWRGSWLLYASCSYSIMVCTHIYSNIH